LGAAGNAALQRRGQSEMDTAPDLPAAPGLEPERPEGSLESFPEHRPSPGSVPGFEPEGQLEPLPGFPDQRGELPGTDIMDAKTLPDGTQPMPGKTRGGQDWEPAFETWMANEGQRLLNRRGEKPTEPIASSESFIWTGLHAYKPGIRTNGLSGKRRRYFEWDFGGGGRHQSEIEVFDQNANHIGAMDPLTGSMKEGSRVEGRETDISRVDDDDNTAFV